MLPYWTRSSKNNSSLVAGLELTCEAVLPAYPMLVLLDSGLGCKVAIPCACSPGFSCEKSTVIHAACVWKMESSPNGMLTCSSMLSMCLLSWAFNSPLILFFAATYSHCIELCKILRLVEFDFIPMSLMSQFAIFSLQINWGIIEHNVLSVLKPYELHEC